MPLRHEPDAGVADWFAASASRGAHWIQVCSTGPDGFDARARVFHAERTSEPRVESLEGNLRPELLLRLTGVLARHTSTPSDCFFALWDGFGDIYGGGSVSYLYLDDSPRWWRRRSGSRRARGRHPGPPPQRVPDSPAFADEVLASPRLNLGGGRRFLLFRGALADAGDWGTRPSGLDGQQINSPNLMWPADRAWFCATEIDYPWTGVSGSQALIDELMQTRGLDVEEFTPDVDLEHPPYWVGDYRARDYP